MQTIRFDRHPAWVTLGDGLSIAFGYWRASWQLWILPVAAMVLVNVLVSVVFGRTALDAQEIARVLDSAGSGQPFSADVLPPAVVAGPLAVALVSIVVDWFLTAIAVAGLRGRPITTAWVVGAGLRSFAASLLTGFVALAVSLVVVIVAVAVPVALLGLFIAIPVAVYLAIRIAFWNVAIFDGAGVLDGLDVTWRISRGSVLRMFGWGLGAAVLGLVVSLGAAPITIILAIVGVPVVGGAITAGLGAAFRAFSMILLAVLYESQRWRLAPPVMPVAPVAPGSPLGPPPPPPPPPWFGPRG